MAGDGSRTFEEEAAALGFKDNILSRFTDLEVIVRPAHATRGGLRFFWKEGRVVSEAFDRA
jgi:hypothetical protein